MAVLLACNGGAIMAAAKAASGVKRLLPAGMVHLRQIDASIEQDMRYAGRHNFLGRRVRGYLAGTCILTRRTALALRRVQRRLRKSQLSLKVYDCYRPRRAVRDFVRWARRKGDRIAKAEFYPQIDKTTLFARHFISKHSKHSYGNTVDLTIVPLGSQQPSIAPGQPRKACHLPKARRVPDNSLELGTGFDCFHRWSGNGLPRSKTVAWRNRRLLNRVMRAAGFHGYHREWWHFTLRGAGTDRPMYFPVR